MKITSDNYEIWFLDYSEGKLNSQEMEEVRLFLSEHPDLSVELEAWSPVTLADHTIFFPDKQSLKKEKYDHLPYLETTAVAALEGDLDEPENLLFQKWLARNPEKQILIRSLSKTKLKPNPEVRFPGKGRLKKKERFLTGWIQFSSAAALLVLLFALFYPRLKDEQKVKILVESSDMPSLNEPVKASTDLVKKRFEPTAASQPAKNPSLPNRGKSGWNKIPTQNVSVIRNIEQVSSLQMKTVALYSEIPVMTDLMPVTERKIPVDFSREIPLSQFLKNRLLALKANEPTDYFTREEVMVAGLHLFSRLPGKHLTGKRGNDGRLKSISFNTALLAFTIPVNR
jgi:hypothetical protein